MYRTRPPQDSSPAVNGASVSLIEVSERERACFSRNCVTYPRMFGVQPAALVDRKPKGPSAGLDSDSRRQESGGSLFVLARALVKHPASGLRRALREKMCLWTTRHVARASADGASSL